MKHWSGDAVAPEKEQRLHHGSSDSSNPAKRGDVICFLIVESDLMFPSIDFSALVNSVLRDC
jgi:hypothetical protein